MAAAHQAVILGALQTAGVACLAASCAGARILRRRRSSGLRTALSCAHQVQHASVRVPVVEAGGGPIQPVTIEWRCGSANIAVTAALRGVYTALLADLLWSRSWVCRMRLLATTACFIPFGPPPSPAPTAPRPLSRLSLDGVRDLKRLHGAQVWCQHLTQLRQLHTAGPQHLHRRRQQ